MTIDAIKVLNSLLVIFLIGFMAIALYYLIHIGNKYVDEDKRINLTTKKIRNGFFFILFLLVSGLLLYKYSILRLILGAAAFSVLFAFLLNPVLIFLEKRKFKRATAVIFIYLSLLLIVLVITIGIIPGIAEQIGNIMSKLPEYWTDAMGRVAELEREWDLKKHGISLSSLNYQEIIANADSQSVKNWIDAAISSAASLPKTFLSIFLVLVFTFFMLINKTEIYNHIINLLPEEYAKKMDENQPLLIEINLTIGQFLKGKIIMAAFVGVTTAIMLFLFDIDFAVLIGLLTFFGDIIPYVGPFMGFLPAVFFALISSPIKAVIVGVLFVFLQWIENNVVAPKVLGKRTGMHPLLVLICITAGGGTFGLWGMIFSVPVAAVVINIVNYFINKKNEESKNEKNGFTRG